MKLLIKLYKRIIPAAVFGFICIIFLLGFTELPWILSKPITIPENIRPSPVIVVLYCGYGDILKDGLDKYSLARFQKALQLWKNGFASHILFTGGGADRRGNGLPGAMRMALAAIKWGIPKEKICVEQESKDTRHNVKNSSLILKERGWNNLILVTNDFHMKRAAGLFERKGFQVNPAPVEWQTRGEWSANWEYLRLLRYEFQARAAYLLLSEKQIDSLINFLRPS